MIEKFESVILPETEKREARKTWQTPQVIEGTLDEAENGAAGTVDGGILS
jgi:hypothetical protein